jgi:hypothetical protein
VVILKKLITNEVKSSDTFFISFILKDYMPQSYTKMFTFAITKSLVKAHNTFI